MLSIEEKVQAQVHKITRENSQTGQYGFEFGFGEGIDFILNDYISFGLHLITDRHMTSLEDGLKPTQRSAVYVEHERYKKGGKGTRKAAASVTDVMNDHRPHGDLSIYNTITKLVDTNGSAKIPTHRGVGNLGSRVNSGGQAAMRYPELGLSETALPLFDSESVMDFQESRANDKVLTPRVLPSRYPYFAVGINQEGTAIGLASRTTIYDVNEVADLLIDYLNGKDISNTILAPDFVTGSYIVQNTKEFAKLMRTGRGSVKLRGHHAFKGTEIYLSKLPHGVSLQTLVREINALELKGVTAYEGTSFGAEPCVTVQCPSVASTKSVFNKIQLQTSFQKTIHFQNRYLDENGCLITVGLHEALIKWSTIRRNTIEKKLNKELTGLNAQLANYEPLVRLIRDSENHKIFMGIYSDIDRPESDADQFLQDFGIESEEARKFILGRTMRSLRNGGRYIDTYESLVSSISDVEKDLSDLTAVQIREIKQMKTEWGIFERVCPITSTEVVKAEVTEDHYPVTVIIDKNRVAKTTGTPVLSDESEVFECTTEDILLVGLRNGCVQSFRVAELPDGNPNVSGVPINTIGGNEFDVIFNEIAEPNKEIYMIYRTGHMSFFDTTPFYRNERTRRLMVDKLPTGYLPYIAESGVWSEELEDRIYFLMGKREACWVDLKDVKRKATNSVTRIYVPFEGAKLWVTNREDFKDFPYNTEEYNRQRPVKTSRMPAGFSPSQILAYLVKKANRGDDITSLDFEVLTKELQAEVNGEND